jgi:hypothetical protein
LSRAGARLPPRTYGVAWRLVEARTGSAIADRDAGSGEPVSIEAAGIVAGSVLWVVRLDVA